jgi:hypothetical protein
MILLMKRDPDHDPPIIQDAAMLNPVSFQD